MFDTMQIQSINDFYVRYSQLMLGYETAINCKRYTLTALGI